MDFALGDFKKMTRRMPAILEANVERINE